MCVNWRSLTFHFNLWMFQIWCHGLTRTKICFDVWKGNKFERLRNIMFHNKFLELGLGTKLEIFMYLLRLSHPYLDGFLLPPWHQEYFHWINETNLSWHHAMQVNISSVVEFQRWWVLKSKLFGQESTCHQGKIFKKFLRVMTVHQKVPKLYFQSQFWMSKINRIFSKKIFI